MIRALLIAALVLLGCSSEPPAAPPGAASITVGDSLGREVRIPEPAKRVLSLAPGNTEIAFALDAGGRLVGRTTACNFPAAAAKVPTVGNLFPPDYERIVATRPDLVLMIDGSIEVRRTLVARGVPVFVYQPRALQAAYVDIVAIGRLLGREIEAQRLTTEMRTRVEAVGNKHPAKRPRVFYEVWPEPLTTAGPRTFLSDVIRAAGGTNIVDDPGSDWPKYPLEKLVIADPDVVVTAHRSTEKTASTRPGWSSLRAVRSGRLVRVPDPDLFARAGPRVVDGIEWLAKALRQ